MQRRIKGFFDFKRDHVGHLKLNIHGWCAFDFRIEAAQKSFVTMKTLSHKLPWRAIREKLCRSEFLISQRRQHGHLFALALALGRLRRLLSRNGRGLRRDEPEILCFERVTGEWLAHD